MSLRLAHELGLALAVSLGLLAVLLGGELPGAVWAAMLAPWAGMALSLRGAPKGTLVGTALALGGFAWAALLLLEQGLDGSMLAAGLALVGIVVGRVLTRRTPGHDLQALVLSLLLVFAGTVLHQQVTYGVTFVLYAVAVTWALISRQLVAGAMAEAARRNDQRALAGTLGRRDVVTPTFFAVTAAVAVTILLSSAVLFVLFPRVGLDSLTLRGRAGNRMPGDVSLQGTPRALAGGTAVVARVRGLDERAFVRGLYLRGSIYDQIDAAGFRRSRSLNEVSPRKVALAADGPPAHYEVFLEPISEQALLALGPVARARQIGQGFASGRLIRGIGDELLAVNPITSSVRYVVDGSLATPRRTPARSTAVALDASFTEGAFERHFLRLPARLDARVVPLARRIVGDAVGLPLRAQRLRRFLLDTFTYTLEQPNAGKADPLAAFLFDDRRGHCEYFATAFATLLRAVGVPSRVVGGFAGGAWDEADAVAVFTGANAHAWVEWYDPSAGWVVDDATPADSLTTLRGLPAWIERLRRAWDDQVVSFGFAQQMELLGGMVATLRSPQLALRLSGRQAAALLAAAVAAGLALWGWRRLRRGRRVPLSPLTAALTQGLERLHGAPLPPAWTLREAVGRTAGLPLPGATRQLLQRALGTYEAMRFAAAPPQPLLPGELKQLRQLRRPAAGGPA